MWEIVVSRGNVRRCERLSSQEVVRTSPYFDAGFQPCRRPVFRYHIHRLWRKTSRCIKNRMNQELSSFAARLRERIPLFSDVAADIRSLKFQEPRTGTPDPNQLEPPHPPSLRYDAASVGCYENEFDTLALELFALQLKHNPAYRKICAGRKLMPGAVEHWTEIPVVPTAVFKELELSCIPPAERTAVFHSSGTTEQKSSRHFHHTESLAVYEASVLTWFARQVVPECGVRSAECGVLILTPPPEQAPHSSLVHMFETIRRRAGESAGNPFFGTVAADGSWTLDFPAVIDALSFVCSCSRSSRGNEPHSSKSEIGNRKSEMVKASSRRRLRNQRTSDPILLLGTAFSFVHLLDYLAEKKLSFQLPPDSRVMETGGYKNRSRTMPKAELHALITERLGIPPENIICEYGMSELSSQAYDLGALASRRRASSLPAEQPAGEISLRPATARQAPALPGTVTGHFHFPPWARVQIISPETGGEVAEGETGLIRVFDLANVFSVMAVQTEDLGIRRGDGFELIGRAALAEARGCSLMTGGERIL
jgi:hypothetical protein